MNKHKLNIGVLISGGGSNMQALMDACEDGSVNGRIVFAGSDNPEAKGLMRAKNKKIPVFSVDYSKTIRMVKDDLLAVPDDLDLNDVISRQNLFEKDSDPERVRAFFRARATCEAKLLEEMKSHDFDLLVLAGFMRTLSPYFIDRVNTDTDLPRIMNIHPALLPSFPGVDGYGDTFRYGCKVGGCTVHFVDYGEDSGPIIGQKSFPILPDDTLESVKEKGLKLEWELYSECVELYARRKLKVINEKHETKTGKTVERKIVKILP